MSRERSCEPPSQYFEHAVHVVQSSKTQLASHASLLQTSLSDISPACTFR